jgi:large exoprotein involved in heme utilization and adhesion
MVRLTNSRISTSVADGTGGGGNIKIDPQFVILQNSQIIAQANAGAGGEINVTAGVFLADPNSVVDASSKSGPQGTVNIQSPVQNLGEQLSPLAQQFSNAAALLAQRCAARVADGKFSTFVVAGREGLPVEPGGFLASPSWTAALFGSNLSAQYPRRLNAAVTGAFPEYDARPIQLAKYGDACH